MRLIFVRFIQFVLMLLPLTSCHVGRYFYWNFATIKDYQKFPFEKISKAEAPFHFQHNQLHPGLPEKYHLPGEPNTLEAFLEQHKTVAFLVIKDGSLIYEQYFDGYDASEMISTFSVTKAFVSAMIGIAIEDGFISSEQQPVTDFIPELLRIDPRFELITLEHLLNMRSGIRFNEGYANPFADMAKYYYGINLNKYINRIKIERPPDEAYNYISVNTQLLGVSLERATSVSMAAYLENKLWQPLGMQYDATWNVDSKRHRQIKAFCCLNARPVDLAKFGQLYLNNGQWNGMQVVPAEWIKKSMQIVNDSRDSQGYPYTFHWRVKTEGAIFAKGILGQYIYVFPEKNIVIVRMGKKEAGIVWPEFFEALCNQL